MWGSESSSGSFVGPSCPASVEYALNSHHFRNTFHCFKYLMKQLRRFPSWKAQHDEVSDIKHKPSHFGRLRPSIERVNRFDDYKGIILLNQVALFVG